MNINASEISSFQENKVVLWHAETPVVGEDGFWGAVAENHLNNFLLWHEEDIARRDDLGFERVYEAKRTIDRYNQQRNNCMEQIDELLIAYLQPSPAVDSCNSETPGMIIDRLSILSLKAYHMKEETERKDASLEHIEKCKNRYSLIIRQKQDLSRALQQLFDDILAGKRTFKVYFQCKMYNDPSLNPQLRSAKFES